MPFICNHTLINAIYTHHSARLSGVSAPSLGLPGDAASPWGERHPSQQQEARLFRFHPQDRGHESLVLRQRLTWYRAVSSGRGEANPGSIDAPTPATCSSG